MKARQAMEFERRDAAFSYSLHINNHETKAEAEKRAVEKVQKAEEERRLMEKRRKEGLARMREAEVERVEAEAAAKAAFELAQVTAM